MKPFIYPNQLTYAPLNREIHDSIPFIPYILGKTFSSAFNTDVLSAEKQALNCYQFEYVTDGICYVEIDNCTYTFTAGDFFYIKKSRYRKLYAKKDSSFEKLFFNAKGAFVDAVVSQYLPDDTLITCKGDFSRYFLNMMKLCEDAQETDDVLLNSLGVEFLKLVHKVSETIKKEPTSEVVCSAESIMYYIDSNLQNKFSLDDLSGKFFLSNSQIVNIFRKKFKTTPMKYALEQRVELAKYYLAKTSIPICEIPQILPFGNSQYFSSVFKKYTGVSPREYRNKYQSK